jgi:hypothetical protein
VTDAEIDEDVKQSLAEAQAAEQGAEQAPATPSVVTLPQAQGVNA